MNDRLRWGILGTGLIAKRFAKGVKASDTGELVAVGSRSRSTAESFAKEFEIPRAYASYEELLADSGVDAVYVSTPHPMHAEWTIKAAEAGKHILVEKPIGMNTPEALAMIDAAREHDVFLMEAFMYRCTPQTRKIVEIVRSGVLGEIRMIHASFSYNTNAPADSRFFSQALGGGGILDVGCYPLSMARLIAGAATGKPFDEPAELKGCGHLGVTGTDDCAVASLRFPGGICAELSTGLRVAQEEVVWIYGSEASLFVPTPWVAGYGYSESKLILRKNYAADSQEIIVRHDKDLYAVEADAVAASIEKRQAPEMSWDDSLGNIRALDRWRREIGLVYDLEKPENALQTITHRPLRKSADAPMKYGKIKGLEKPVSRLVFGCDSNNTMPDTSIMLDEFFTRGGNAFDTSYAYGNPNGAPEINLGSWVRQRGVRDQVVVIEKGANFAKGNPEGLTYELVHGLERLQMDCVDIYMIHRDNEQVPIGEWADVLNENLKAGRMKIFGLSNFSIPRLKAFDEYARSKGLASFSVVSNQLSLARVLAPLWDMHLVSSSDCESRKWFEKTQTPMLSWSSQARGFFTDRASRENKSDPELCRCWYGEENFRRKERVNELAKKRGVEPINIALAWVLNLPFPTFPLIGPKRPAEIRSCLAALEVKLSPDEMKWLDLEA